MPSIKSLPLLHVREMEDGSHIFTLKQVRGSYLHLFQPWAKNESETKRYSGKFIAANDTHEKEIAALRKYIDELCKDWFKSKLKGDLLCFKDGDNEAKEEFEDAWFLSAGEKLDNPPSLIDRDKTKLTAADDKLYSGAFVNVMFKFWKQDNKHGKRVNANLMAVQYFGPGEKFGNGGGGVSKQDLDEGFEEYEEAGDDGFDD